MFLPVRLREVMHTGTEYCMRVDGRNFGKSRNKRLKKTHDLPGDRFNDLARSESVARLDRLADVRSSVVARGKALIANPNYPGPEIIRQMSLLFARKLRL